MENALKVAHEVFPEREPPSDEAKAKAHKLACQILDYRGDGRPRVRGVGRDIIVAMYRELAARLERGELDGARAQWLCTNGGCFSANDDGFVVSGIEFTMRGPNFTRLGTAEVIEDAYNAPLLSIVAPRGEEG